MNAAPSPTWTSLGQPILVAVDGHTEDLDAVAWAAAEAIARRTNLTVLHVCRWPLHEDPLSAMYPLLDPCDVLDDARQILETAADQAREIAPDLVVNVIQGIGDPGRLIVAESKHACLVVVGRREESAPRGPRRRSVTRQVVARSSAPVAVVGHCEPPPVGPAAGRVVAALLASLSAPSRSPVLHAAFTAAQRRGVGVTILAYGSPFAGNPDAGSEAPATESTMQLYTRVFADVDVRRGQLAGPLGHLLERESQSAALLVIPAPVRSCRLKPSGPTLALLLSVVSAPMTLVRGATNPV